MEGITPTGADALYAYKRTLGSMLEQAPKTEEVSAHITSLTDAGTAGDTCVDPGGNVESLTAALNPYLGYNIDKYA